MLRATVLSILAALAWCYAASARDSLWYTTPTDLSPEQILARCDEIIARQNEDRVGMIDAGHLLEYGMLMGHPCAEPDAARALDLYRSAGDKVDFDALLGLLKFSAASGHQRSIDTLAKADISPFPTAP